jgi:hypothetical protein
MDGSCDVSGCQRETYMGWRPLTKPLGRKICEHHWRRHNDNDPDDDFNLWDAFGFRRPIEICKLVAKKDAPWPAPESDPGRVVFTEPAAKPEPPQQRPGHYEPEKVEPQIIPAVDRPSRCKACGGLREAGHTYCQGCARERRQQAHQERQRRYREKHIQAVKA